MSLRTVEMDVTRYAQGKASPLKETVPIEAPAEVILNERPVATLSCTPVDLEYLGVGHLVSRGLLQHREQLLSVETARDGETVKISIRAREDVEAGRIPDRPSNDEVGQDITVDGLLAAMRFLEERSAFFRATGSAHRTVVFRGAELLADHEDIARHNTLDKVLGRFFCEQVPTKSTVLCTTGRLFYEIVSKGAAGGFPVIASKGAATDRAVDLAVRAGITLVGFARGDRFNIYSHPRRIKA